MLVEVSVGANHRTELMTTIAILYSIPLFGIYHIQGRAADIIADGTASLSGGRRSRVDTNFDRAYILSSIFGFLKLFFKFAIATPPHWTV